MLSRVLEQFRSARVACARLGLVAFVDAAPGVRSVLVLSDLIVASVKGGNRAMWAQLPYLLGNFLFGMSSIVAINSTVTQLHSKLTSQSDGRAVSDSQAASSCSRSVLGAPVAQFGGSNLWYIIEAFGAPKPHLHCQIAYLLLRLQ